MEYLDDTQRKILVCNIKVLTELNNYSTEMIASSIFESRTNYYRMLSGEKPISFGKAKMIADFFDKDLEEMLELKSTYSCLYLDEKIITKEDYGLAKSIVLRYLETLRRDDWINEIINLETLMINTLDSNFKK